MHDRFFQSTPFEKVELHPERLSKIDSTKPKVVFVDSASDLFHEKVPFEFITECFSVMQRNPFHTFVVLTKRAKRMHEYFIWARESNPEWHLFYPLENVWLGVTAENQDMADERIPYLLNTPAKHRFVSVEPMLGTVNMEIAVRTDRGAYAYEVLTGKHWLFAPKPTIGNKLDLVICGGETGKGARVMQLDWVRRLRDQCAAAHTPFFFKQWGEWVPDMNDSVMVRSRATGIGRKLDGREWNDLPWRKKAEPVKASAEVQLSLEVK
jgi:protein gp37